MKKLTSEMGGDEAEVWGGCADTCRFEGLERSMCWGRAHGTSAPASGRILAIFKKKVSGKAIRKKMVGKLYPLIFQSFLRVQNVFVILWVGGGCTTAVRAVARGAAGGPGLSSNGVPSGVP